MASTAQTLKTASQSAVMEKSMALNNATMMLTRLQPKVTVVLILAQFRLGGTALATLDKHQSVDLFVVMAFNLIAKNAITLILSRLIHLPF